MGGTNEEEKNRRQIEEGEERKEGKEDRCKADGSNAPSAAAG